MNIKETHNFIELDKRQGYADGVMMCSRCKVSYLKFYEYLFFGPSAIYKLLTCDEMIIKDIIE